MRRLQFCLTVFAVLALSLCAIAQVQNGQFTGTVTDPTGAAIANAKVAVKNPATDLTSTATTNSSGNYSIRELPVGNYTITVEAAGFKTASATAGINAGTISHVDFKMLIGKASEIVEVTGGAALVNTEDSKLATTVSSTQINNLPLNGRNVFDLMQLSAGAVNVAGVDFENGHSTVVNGVREDFNGFLINGVSNKGLSGGTVNTPIQDTVEEFQQLGLNMSAQYGSSAGSNVNLVTKSGTNAFHGSLWWFNRNDMFDANEFFVNQSGHSKPPLRFNQYGFTLGGPIVKDKLFFFGSFQGDRFRTVGTPITVTQESPEWRAAVKQADANTGVSSVANLLYGTFNPAVQGTGLFSLDCYVLGGSANCPAGVGVDSHGNPVPLTDSGFSSYVDYLCPDSYGSGGLGGNPTQAQMNLLAARMQSILGVTAADNFASVPVLGGSPCSVTPSLQAGTVGRNALTGSSKMFLQNSAVAIFSSQTQNLGNLFNGNEASLRVDYNWNSSNRLFANYNLFRQTDKFGPCAQSCTRGFNNPEIIREPNGQLTYVHTFSPTVLNEIRAGYSQNVSPLLHVSAGGVPSVGYDDGSLGFGSYNGYPQSFKENVYSYGDMVTISHGNHNMKVGVDFRRNIENSEFNVARPSYYFFDPIFFAADSPYGMAAGVSPNICKPPCSQSTIQGLIASNTVPNANLQSNIRHWRNREFGAYFQDDWKLNKRLTLNLGLRYDLYARHNEEANAATTFILGPSTLGNDIIHRMIAANAPAGSPGCNTNAAQEALAQLAGVCGPGGFAPANSLGKGRHKDFGPRVGFAWDVFGDGKTSLRGGFGISFEGTLYNPLSNSRWNLPYYSFNNVTNYLGADVNSVVYGPTNCTSGSFPNNCVSTGGVMFGPGGVAPTFSGPPSGTQGQGTTGAQAAGNIDGWNGQNPNLALLTGIVLPQGIDDPYVYNFYLGIQREIMPKTVLEVNYVGTAGHKLFRAEDINRLPGTLLPAGVTLTNNIGEHLLGYGHRPNPNYGRLRVWENVVNSNYNSLQASLKRQMSHGLLLNVNYTYSHSIDNGSTWHSGATTANGVAGGEGFTTDPTHPEFDRGNSIYDFRHRLVLNHVWQLPGYNMKGAAGYLLGGWSLNGIWSFQTGAHWQPFRGGARRLVTNDPKNFPLACKAATFDPAHCVNAGGDYLLTRGRNERPNSSDAHFSDFTHSTWANGWGGTSQSNLPVLSAPCLGCLGNLGRNNFVGPGLWTTDLTLSKVFTITERVNLKFESSAFNVFNRANFLLATTGGGAHNDLRDGQFGKAAGTLNARNMQFGLKLSF